MPSHATLVLLGVGALGLWLGFPNALLHLPPLSLLYPLALVLLGTSATGKVDALRKGWLAGLAGASAGLYWLALPVHDVGGMPWVLAAPCAMGIGAYVGLYGGIYCVCAYSLRNYDIGRRALALGLLWYAVEALRGTVLTGFPWLSLATAFAPWPMMIQGASLVGSYALGGIMVTACLLICTSLPGSWIQTLYPKPNTLSKQLKSLSFFMGVGIFLSMALGGHYTLGAQSKQAPQALFSVLMVEGNIDQNIKWEVSVQQSTVDQYLDLTRQGLATMGGQNKPALIVWPETSMPFYFDRHPKFGPAVADFVREMDVPLVLGAPGAIRKGRDEVELFNRAYLLNGQGKLAGFYDKTHLVPFGEYLPPMLDLPFLRPLLQGVGDFTPGKASAPLRSGNLALGMLICYESIFPEIAQKRVADGANVLLNISNDGWFGDSAAPEQHLQLAVLRAVEQKRWLIRSTNTGISAIVDPHGQVTMRGGQFKAQSLPAQAGLVTEKSLYHHWASWLPFIAALLLCLTIFTGPRPRRP